MSDGMKRFEMTTFWQNGRIIGHGIGEVPNGRYVLHKDATDELAALRAALVEMVEAYTAIYPSREQGQAAQAAWSLRQSDAIEAALLAIHGPRIADDSRAMDARMARNTDRSSVLEKNDAGT